MYVLICVGFNGVERPDKVSKTKKLLVEYLSNNGYYFSKSVGRYIDDKTCGISGGTGVDYYIKKIEELKQE